MDRMLGIHLSPSRNRDFLDARNAQATTAHRLCAGVSSGGSCWLPIVKRQYGVYDKTNGTVVICKDRDHALKAAADGDRFIVMRRSVSEWMSDE